MPAGHGTCYLGFCKCRQGWYGTDCSRQRKGLATNAVADGSKGGGASAKSGASANSGGDGGGGGGGGDSGGAFSGGAPAAEPWLDLVMAMPPAALDPPPQPTRKRPLIYIYDLPPAYNTRMLQASNKLSIIYLCI